MPVLECDRAPADFSLTPYFREINETSLLDPEEEQELAWRVQEGDEEARAHMVKANLRLVVAVARKFAGRGLCLPDLIQEGNLGLLHAVERFDPVRETRFCTYAKFWIKEAIQKALEKMAGPVRMPGYVNDLMINWRQAAKELHARLGRTPTDEDVAACLKLSPQQLTIVKKALRISSSLPNLGTDAENHTSIEDPVDFRTATPAATLAANDEMQHVLKLLDQLEEREAAVLRLRFGLSGNEPMTLQDIGKKLDLTRERVRQIEREALAKMRDLLVEAN